MLEESINLLTKLMIEAHFNKEFNKEEKIRLVIKALKVIKKYD